MKAVNIHWDIDEDILDGSLPDSVEIPSTIDEDGIADYLSDTFSFCVFSYDVEK